MALPSDPADRKKLFIVAGCILLCAVWLVYYFGPGLSFRGESKPMDTPAWKISAELNAKLIADHDFADVAIGAISENPLKFSAVGAVFRQKDLDRLPDVLKELRPDAEFEIKVELIKR